MPNDFADRQQLWSARFNLIVAIFCSFIGFGSHSGFRQREIVFRLMWSQRVIKPDELVRDESEVSFTEENEVVQTLGL